MLRREHPGHHETVLAICDEAMRQLGRESDPWMRQRFLHFFIEKSVVLKELGRIEDDIALRDEVAARHEDDPGQALREHAQRVIEAMDRRLSA